MIFNVTEQTATVVERTYQLVADNAEDAISALEEMDSDSKSNALFHSYTKSKSVEIIDTKEVDLGR